MRPHSVEVSGLTVEQIVEIGTNASGVLRRMFGRPQAYDAEDGVRWDVGSRGGVMSFLVEELPGGHRVTGRATRVAAQHTNIGARATGKDDWSRSLRRANIITNWLYWVLRVPKNARKLLRQRKRTLRAIDRAGAPIAVVTPQPTVES